MLVVSVNDRPLDVPAVVRRGRAMVPTRATFGALGATVSYDPNSRAIVAYTAEHAVRMTIGVNAALVDGRDVRLDAPPLVLGARTYVPLRFVAQAMGAAVAFDSGMVSVTMQHASATAQTVPVSALDPPADATIATAYPTISASLGSANAARADVTLTLDGQDVTAPASFDGSTITFMPRTGLARGTHQVAFTGRTDAGRSFSASWSFATTLAAPPDPGPDLYTDYGYRFYVDGANAFYPGDWMHFVLVAPPGGSAVLQLCGLGYQYGFWNGGYGATYQADVAAPLGYWLPSCQVTAIYTSWNGARTYVPIPLFVGLYTHPQFTPQPARTPAPTPTPKRTAAPIAAPTPTIAPMRTPAPTRTYRPVHPPPVRPPPARPRPTPR